MYETENGLNPTKVEFGKGLPDSVKIVIPPPEFIDNCPEVWVPDTTVITWTKTSDGLNLWGKTGELDITDEAVEVIPAIPAVLDKVTFFPTFVIRRVRFWVVHGPAKIISKVVSS